MSSISVIKIAYWWSLMDVFVLRVGPVCLRCQKAICCCKRLIHGTAVNKIFSSFNSLYSPNLSTPNSPFLGRVFLGVKKNSLLNCFPPKHGIPPPPPLSPCPLLMICYFQVPCLCSFVVLVTILFQVPSEAV